MTFMLCRNRVADYDAWRKVFDAHLSAQGDAGLTLERVWRADDDPNNVFFLFAVADVDKAKAFINDPAAEEAGRVSGVIDGEIHFVSDVD